MKLYLAHPLPLRAWIRKIELEIEKDTGIELLNPFYDTGRDDIEDIDAGRKGRSDPSLDFINIVEKDLSNVQKSDGVLAYVTTQVHSIGTLCEIWEAVKLGLPVFVISPDSTMHPWIRYATGINGGMAFESWDDAKAYFTAKEAA
jgi:nucleoside 2-deoxyribosyltransferase